MPRTAKGSGELERALEVIAQAKTVEQLRQAQAVALPLICGLNMQETAKVIGCSVGWASRLRNRFLAGEMVGDQPTRGGRRRQHMSEAEERQILQPYLDRARQGTAVDVGQVKADLEKKLGRTIALSTVYNLLRRHGWRRPVAEKRTASSEE
ncbi:helix-turn-helix domain-containing protein [Allofranklinella schreckenbergeri]|uniref:helix-turn-helix domain-containing protein n=1 Tax=Allofranklinella schreckenbergeri TaxID=1076744 RepID=UPI000F5E7FEC|nr:sigma-70 family RNA polymerase sigma factor [Allofranklinella schreckenbergeri]